MNQCQQLLMLPVLQPCATLPLVGLILESSLWPCTGCPLQSAMAPSVFLCSSSHCPAKYICFPDLTSYLKSPKHNVYLHLSAFNTTSPIFTTMYWIYYKLSATSTRMHQKQMALCFGPTVLPSLIPDSDVGLIISEPQAWGWVSSFPSLFFLSLPLLYPTT